jgi:formylglycine-generating enzyme required for sulfatase activity
MAGLVALLAHGHPAWAGFECTPDMVKSGQTCIDTYEASVWRIPNPLDADKRLVSKVKKGTATAADLTAASATQLGTASDDYAPCTDNGQNCTNDIYAVSIAGTTPAAYITWFQAQQACKNSEKRLPSNAEWQAAVAGTPDPGPDNGTTDCNTASAFVAVNTGSRSSCVSADGAFDMVGNLYEWVADWVPLSTACPSWGAFSNDDQCFAGASTGANNGPGALLRGGFFSSGANAGPLAVSGAVQPSSSNNVLGFRCAR